MSIAVTPHDYSDLEHQTWKALFDRQSVSRKKQIHPMFQKGIDALQLPGDRVPNLDQVNERLQKLTGFRGVWVDGHEDPKSFFPMLKAREFPIGNFIRSIEDLGYTPAPDVFHDLYGHLPFLANKEYADFTQYFGEVASPYIDEPELCRQFERLFWFTLEFSLIETDAGVRVLGAGLASSQAETEFALSHEPEVMPFDIEKIRQQEFKIDEFQKRIFLIQKVEDLYNCLDAFNRGVRQSKKN